MLPVNCRTGPLAIRKVLQALDSVAGFLMAIWF